MTGLNDTARLDALAGRGMALILPEGVPRAGRTQRDWAVRDGGAHPRDDLAFLDDVLTDAQARGVDRSRLLLAGFSRGGSMVWTVACERPEMFRAYAPVAGAFWNPLPSDCAGPVRMLHTHGWADRVVPLEGRPLGGGRVVQGDVFASLFILRDTLGCDARQPDETSVTETPPRWLRRWSNCREGGLTLILHPGGHQVPADWSETALDWFAQRLSVP